MSIAARNGARVGARYRELIERFPLRPLRIRRDYLRALKMVDELATRDESSLTSDEQDYLSTLSLLVEEYDAAHKPRDVDVDPLAVLRHLMEAHDMNTTSLGRLLGSKGVASEVLNGKRSLSKAHICALAERFNVDASVFFPSTQGRRSGAGRGNAITSRRAHR